jgi:hypothetical protein
MILCGKCKALKASITLGGKTPLSNIKNSHFFYQITPEVVAISKICVAS